MAVIFHIVLPQSNTLTRIISGTSNPKALQKMKKVNNSNTNNTMSLQDMFQLKHSLRIDEKLRILNLWLAFFALASWLMVIIVTEWRFDD